MHLERQKPPEVLSRQQANDLIKRIRKLRWMGMQEEAERLQVRLAQCPAPPADTVLATPSDTD